MLKCSSLRAVRPLLEVAIYLTRWWWRRHNCDLTFKEMSESFKQPPARLPHMYLFVSPILPSVIPRTVGLITFLFAFLINVLFILCAWHVLPEIVCKPLALFVRGFLLKNCLLPRCWQKLILWLRLGCEYFWMHLYVAADFAKYLFGVCVRKHIWYYSASLPVIYLLASRVIFFTCHFLVIFRCELRRAGTMPFLAFGKFFVPFNRSLLLHVFWKSKKNALLPFCPGAARSVCSSLVTIKTTSSKAAAILYWY